MKQRLVGALVVGCLALIIVPLLLDGDGITSSDVDTSIPPEPVISMDDLPEPVRPEIAADNSGPVTDSVPAGSEAPEIQLPAAQVDEGTVVQSEADLLPRLDEAGLPEAFSVRLGVFARQANADALLERLIDADFKAYSRTVTNEEGGLTGVFVGPVITRAEANELKDRLQNEFDLNGLVVKFTVEEL